MTGSIPSGSARRRISSVQLPAGIGGARGAYLRPLAGLISVIVAAGVVVLALMQFRGGFIDRVPVTVMSDRAGLMMNPGAKVELHGAQVGTVASIDDTLSGKAAIHLVLDPSRLRLIPANVLVNVTSTTVFGAKFVQLVPPAHPSVRSLRPGQILEAGHVTVEINTVFEQLSAVLSKIEPAKLNETLGAMATALGGRGRQLGQTLSDLNSFLAKIDPSLANMSHELETAPKVLNTYAAAAPDLVKTVNNTTRMSELIVDEQQSLDMLLVSAIGLADVGNDVVGGNRQALTDVLHLLVPTTDLTNEYHAALSCGLTGLIPMANQPPDPNPGFTVLAGLSWGVERYRYPHNLPKVAARGGPQCDGELPVPFNTFPPFDVADVGANPWEYGNQQNLLNSDALKQFLYGPIDGPPRNSAQIGQEG